MNSTEHPRRKILPLLLPMAITGLGLLLATPASAQTLYWYGNGTNLGGDGTWTATGGAQWSSSFTGGGTGGWVDNSVAAFRAPTGAPAGTVTVSGTVRASSLDLSNTGTTSSSWNFSGGAGNAIELTGAGGVISRGIAGGILNISVAITGSQGLTTTGNGTWNFNGPASTYTGNTSFGPLTRLIGLNVLPTATIVTTAGTLDLRANQQFSGLSGAGSATVGNNGTQTLTLSSSSGTPVNFAGTLVQNGTPTNILNLVKTGSFEQQVTGAGASTSNGTVLINGGVLALGKSNGVNALGSGAGAITVQSGTLRLDQSNQLSSTQDLVLAGGTFALNGFSESLDTLDLNANSFITLGTGGAVTFADSELLDWGSFTLTISGIVNGTTLRFGTDATGLSSVQLANLQFANYGNVGGQIDSQGYVTAVPEPTSFALLAGTTVFLFGILRRRNGSHMV